MQPDSRRAPPHTAAYRAAGARAAVCAVGDIVLALVAALVLPEVACKKQSRDRTGERWKGCRFEEGSLRRPQQHTTGCNCSSTGAAPTCAAALTVGAGPAPLVPARSSLGAVALQASTTGNGTLVRTPAPACLPDAPRGHPSTHAHATAVQPAGLHKQMGVRCFPPHLYCRHLPGKHSSTRSR